jgi:eukaryotic-like serine/threonine-protein kinase
MSTSIGTGTRLGPYEILASLGTGGMGVVFRARDHKLDRDVALKVLPAALADDQTALERFAREAKAVASLSHPNILAIYDFGCISATPFAVMELLDGETLRERLARGVIATTRAVAWATKIAEGAAAAHERGIVHRDLKPENIIITRDGQLKILDFGLARVLPVADSKDRTLTTAIDVSIPGMVVGTAGYMAPEQVCGKPVDHRADIFALGCILYEMLASKRAFSGSSAIETMAAILHDEPTVLPLTERAVPPALERIVQHCLEKDPAHRFQSMRDVVFGLSNLSEASTSTATRARVDPARRSRRLRLAVAVSAVIALAATAFWLGTRVPRAHDSAPPAKVSFQTVSFGRGIVDAARFTPDGQTLVYGAAWDGAPFRLFLTRPGSPDTTALGLPDADLLAVSPGGELAIALGYRLEGWMGRGTLARVPMLGAAPRQVADDVLAAEWSPDGAGLAVVRWSGARKRLEDPQGKVLYETGGWVSHPRFSADGTLLAFLDHRVDGDDRGSVAVLELRTGTRRTLGGEWSGVQGLGWSPAGDEVFFSAYDGATPHSVYAVDLQGHTRQLLTAPTGLFLQDVARDGRLLVASQARSIQVLARLAGDAQPRDLSWLAYSFAVDVSADGRTILLECAGDSCGENYTVFVRGTDGTPAVRLGEGAPRELSPDGTQAVALVYGPQPRLVVYPLGAGQPRTIDTGTLAVETVSWLPDGRGLVVLASERGRRKRGYTVDLASGSWSPFTAEGISAGRRIPVSPAGDVAAMLDHDGRPSLFPVAGGPPRAIQGMLAGDDAVRFSSDGRALYLTRHAVPLQILRLDLASGRRELVSELPSTDLAGLQASFPAAVISADGRTVVGTYTRRLNKLYVVTGAR